MDSDNDKDKGDIATISDSEGEAADRAAAEYYAKLGEV